MKAVAFIPFRKGSQRLKDKNIKLFRGTPLYLRAIEQALKQDFEKIFISTDYPLSELSIPNDDRIILLTRPPELSESLTRTQDLLSFYIDTKKITNFDYLVLLQVTSPLRNQSHFDELFNRMNERAFDSLTSCVMVKSKNENPALNLERNGNTYEINGAFYAVSPDFYKQFQTFVNGQTQILEMAAHDSVDIDTQDDFEAAEKFDSKY